MPDILIHAASILLSDSFAPVHILRKFLFATSHLPASCLIIINQQHIQFFPPLQLRFGKEQMLPQFFIQ